jgi:hypothetical protein
MRLLILATAATFVLTGTVMAEGFAPVDANAHDTYIKNLRGSGYNPAGDRNANGKVIVANMYQLKRHFTEKRKAYGPRQTFKGESTDYFPARHVSRFILCALYTGSQSSIGDAFAKKKVAVK